LWVYLITLGPAFTDRQRERERERERERGLRVHYGSPVIGESILARERDREHQIKSNPMLACERDIILLRCALHGYCGVVLSSLVMLYKSLDDLDLFFNALADAASLRRNEALPLDVVFFLRGLSLSFDLRSSESTDENTTVSAVSIGGVAIPAVAASSMAGAGVVSVGGAESVNDW
jgi:hypothetical protein